SKPSPARLEKGRLLGSAQTRSTRPDASSGALAAVARTASVAAVTSVSAAARASQPATAMSVAASATPRTVAMRAPARRSGEGEHIERAPCVGVLRQVGHRADEAAAGQRVGGGEVERHYRPRPAAHAVEHGHVLPAVGAAVADRLADDAGRRAELPEQPAGARVHRLEPAG